MSMDRSNLRVFLLCNDGTIVGNKSLLATYSRLLSQAFKSVTSKPAIRLSRISVKHLQSLFRVFNSLTFAEISNNELTHLQNVARLLEVDLTLRNGRNGFIRVKASPIDEELELNTNELSNDSRRVRATEESRLTEERIESFNGLETQHNIMNPLPTSLPISVSPMSPLINADRDPGKSRENLEVPKICPTMSTQKVALSTDDPKNVAQKVALIEEEPKKIAQKVLSSVEEPKKVTRETNGASMTDLKKTIPMVPRHRRKRRRFVKKITKYTSKGEKTVKRLCKYSTKDYYTKMNDDYKCNVCGFSCSNWITIRAHIETKHLNIQFNCKRCTFVAIWRTEINNHIRKEHKVRSPSQGDYLTIRRTKKMNQEAASNDEPAPVDDCNDKKLECNDIVERDHHHEFEMEEDEDEQAPNGFDKSNKDKLLEADVSQEFENDSLLIKSDFDQTLDDDTDEIVINDSSKLNSFLIVSKEGKRAFKCKLCQTTCQTYGGMKDHQNSQHNGFICVCNYCEAKYRSRSNMFKHLHHNHQVNRNYKDNFRFVKDLESREESNEKYCCKICLYTYSSKASMMNHLIYKHRIRSDVVPFFDVQKNTSVQSK